MLYAECEYMQREVRQAAAYVKSIIHNMPAMPYASALFICDVVNMVCHIFLQLYGLLIFASGFSNFPWKFFSLKNF